MCCQGKYFVKKYERNNYIIKKERITRVIPKDSKTHSTALVGHNTILLLA